METGFQKQEVLLSFPGVRLATGIFEVPRKSTVIQLRWPLVIMCSYFLLYSPGASVPATVIHGFLLLYVLSNAALYFLDERVFQSTYFQVPLVILDTLFLTASLTLSDQVGQDFYVACFFTIFLCCICRDIRGLVGITVLGPVLYGYFLFRSTDVVDPSIYLRIPFPFVIALFYGYFVQVEHVQKAAEERKKEIQDRLATEAILRRELERLAILHEIGTSILSTLDVRAGLALLLEKLESHLPYPVAMAIRLFNTETKELAPLVCHNLKNGDRWHTGQGFAQTVASHKRPYVVRNIQAVEMKDFEVVAVEGLVSFVGLPLIANDEVSGVLSIYSREEHVFSDEEVRFLSAVAAQAAIAVHNAQLHEETQRQAVALERASAVKDQLLGVMSHELRTPLSAILGYVGIVHEQLLGEINAQQKEALGKVLARADDLLNMITSMLYAATIEAKALKVQWTEVSLETFMEDLKALFALPAEKNVTVRWDQPAALPVIRTDALKLKLILRNLIGNALKYTRHGYVDVSVRYFEEARKVRFKVKDTGVGIPQEMLAGIFERFRQANASGNGSPGGVGLGLYIVRNFTETLGGVVEVESEPGRGSTFTVILPAEAVEKKRVLLVEDNEGMVEVLGQELEFLGYQVRTARGGAEAVVMAEAEAPDLIVMDILMPGMDGLQATTAIRSKPATRSIPILAATAEAMPGDREKCLAAGCDHYIAKPFTHRELGAAIEELLRKTRNGAPIRGSISL